MSKRKVTPAAAPSKEIDTHPVDIRLIRQMERFMSWMCDPDQTTISSSTTERLRRALGQVLKAYDTQLAVNAAEAPLEATIFRLEEQICELKAQRSAPVSDATTQATRLEAVR